VLARLPSPAKEGFPSLPYLIDQSRNFAALVTLWLDATAGQKPPPEIEEDMLHFNDLCHALQRRTHECLRQAAGDAYVEEGPPEPEPVAEVVESTVIEETMVTDHDKYNPTQPEPLEAEQDTPPGSSGSDIASSGNKQEMQEPVQPPQGKENKNKNKKKQSDTTDTSQSSTSSKSKSQSKPAKPSRNLFSGLKRKGKGDGTGVLIKDRGWSTRSSGS
jgi:hypothetical protein